MRKRDNVKVRRRSTAQPLAIFDKAAVDHLKPSGDTDITQFRAIGQQTSKNLATWLRYAELFDEASHRRFVGGRKISLHTWVLANKRRKHP